MSTRFEDDLRSALVGATAPPLTIDPDAVLRQGRRTVRTRRTTRAAAAGLVAAAVAAVSVGLLDGGQKLNGGPTDGTGTTRPPVVAGLTLGGQHYAVSIGFDPRDDTNLDFYRVDTSGHRQKLGGSSTKGLGGNATFGHGASSPAILGVVPSDAVSVTAYFLGRPLSASEVTTAPLPGSGYEAVGILPETPDMVARFQGVGWVDHRGVRSTTVQSSDTVATFTLPRSGNQVSVWTDPENPNWGVYFNDGGMASAGTAPSVGAREAIWSGMGAPESDDGFAYGLLPEGATNVRPTLAAGARALSPVETQPLSGVHLTAFVLELGRPPRGSAGHQLRSVSWTNPDGSTGHHTFP